MAKKSKDINEEDVKLEMNEKTVGKKDSGKERWKEKERSE